MRTINRLCAIATSILLCLAASQAQKTTDAETDGFDGPIKSVSTHVTRSAVKWPQPGGPTMVQPIWCNDCEYDADGSKTMSGNIVDGTFFGDSIRLVRNGEGVVTDRYFISSAGDVYTHDVMGPFGRVAETTYRKGKVQTRQTFRYDQYGHETDWSTVDGAGNSEGRVTSITDKDGTPRDRSAWKKDGLLDYQQTFDPETEIEHFSTFDSQGKLQLTWTVDHNKLLSFWEKLGSPSQFGDNFFAPAGDGTEDNYACHNDGTCEVSHLHYEYLNGNNHNLLSAEWRDSDGNLKLATYYQYKVDQYANWTERQVWVWVLGLGERTLYETDTRSLAYWQK